MRQSSRPSRAAAALLLSLASASVAFAAPLDCSSNQSNNTIYTSPAGASYDIICSVDYAGGDVAAQGGVATFEDCIDLCDAQATCIDVSYAGPGGSCYMKSSLGTPNTNGGIWTARNRSTRTNTEVTCLDKKSDGLVYEGAAGGYYQIVCGVDYAGGDLMATSETSFSACVSRPAPTSYDMS